MKRILLLLFIVLSGSQFAQSASDYFPANPGFKWYYEITPLDSLNNPVYSLTSVKADSFAAEGVYYGDDSKLLVSKYGSLSTINTTPWVDSSYIKLDNSLASVYYRFQDYLSQGGSGGLLGFADWIDFYNFSSPAGFEYDIFTFDTTLVYNGQEIPLRYKVSGKRVNDEPITTTLGDFNCKKFEIVVGVYYILELPPPFPPLEVEIVAIENKVWFAPDNWIVKEFQPSVLFDLSAYLPIPPFVIPGIQKNIIPEPEIVLSLQYPNGGEIFYADYTNTILWSSLEVDIINIYYSTDAGQNWEVIEENYPAEQSVYFWTTPQAYSEECLIKIEDVQNNELSDISNDFFTISEGTPDSWTSTMQVFTTPDQIKIVGFGQDPLATDGIDIQLYEFPLDPVTSDQLDARFVLPTGDESLLDYRFNQLENVSWTLKFQPENNGDPLTFMWQPLLLPEGTFTLMDENGGTAVSVNMKTQNSITLTDYNFSTLKIIYQAEEGNSVSVSVNEGWNIVSAPLQMDDMSVTGLYPDATSNVFGFDNGYIQVEELETGSGYWLKFDNEYLYEFSGNIPTENIQLNQGWNIIGVFDSEVNISQLATQPDDIIESNFFGFNNGYVAADVLIPGNGYWIKASESGEIVISENIAAKQNSETSKYTPVNIMDTDGFRTTLYMSNIAVAKNELPPLPPSGVPDVRFSDGTYISSVNNTILMKDLSYPVTLNINSNEFTFFVNGEKTGNSAILNSPDQIVSVENTELPISFALSQNYPNPFNPVTNINFSIASREKVTITVYDMLGKVVENLVNDIYDSGNYTISFNGSNLGSGIYFYKISAGKFIDVKKMTLLK